MDRQLSPAETAKLFAVSVKALRLYEQRGLLTPQRSGAGWRVYGPAQIARLHQIIALKRLGLTLARIGEILAGPDRLETILALQEQALGRDSEQLSRALGLVRAARAKLASGGTLSIDDLATLTQETVLNTRHSTEDIEKYKAAFAPMVAKHFTPDESQRFAAGKSAREADMIAFK
jgi:DNA-binding transcriptional MerR regulator